MTLLDILSVEPTGLSMLLSLPQDGVSFGISNVPSGRSSRALHSGCSIFVQNLHEGTLVFLIQGGFSNRSPRLWNAFGAELDSEDAVTMKSGVALYTKWLT